MKNMGLLLLMVGVLNPIYGDILDFAEKGEAQGTDINAKSPDGKTLLGRASQDGHLEIVKYLIENGADISIQDDPWRKLEE